MIKVLMTVTGVIGLTPDVGIHDDSDNKWDDFAYGDISVIRKWDEHYFSETTPRKLLRGRNFPEVFGPFHVYSYDRQTRNLSKEDRQVNRNLLTESVRKAETGSFLYRDTAFQHVHICLDAALVNPSVSEGFDLVLTPSELDFLWKKNNYRYLMGLIPHLVRVFTCRWHYANFGYGVKPAMLEERRELLGLPEQETYFKNYVPISDKYPLLWP